MVLALNKALSLKDATAKEELMLSDLQANILDGHGRRSTRNIFLRFKEAGAAKEFIQALSSKVTTARQQFNAAKAFRDQGISGGPIILFMLSMSGYRMLEVKEKAPPGTAFSEGMAQRFETLNDPPAIRRELPYRDEIHAMILIGADPDSDSSWTSAAARALEQEILAGTGSALEVLTVETGRAIFRAAEGSTDDTPVKMEGIEHFGYVDGRSQPLMIQELIDRERDESDGTNVWDPAFTLGQVLVPDPGAPAAAAETAFGSFFVFRKLEQNIAAFKDAEETMGIQSGLGELAGAMLVGRFEDGTPVTLQREDGADNPVENNFDYAGDMGGLRCPFHAHIRKTNPRGDVGRNRFLHLPRTTQVEEDAYQAALKSVLPGERKVIMARRGMPYGRRDRIINPSDRPTGGVGLMFMAYQQSLEDQFEFTQQSWANNSTFATGLRKPPLPTPPPVGRDPIIGQKGDADAIPLLVRDRWGWREAEERPVVFEEHVTFRGGEYFFAPAISTLATL